MPLSRATGLTSRTRAASRSRRDPVTVLLAWPDTGSPARMASVPSEELGAWRVLHKPVDLVYDPCDGAPPKGSRTVAREGSRRLRYAADELEVLIRVVRSADRFEVVGQIVNEGVPTADVPTAGVPVRLAGAGDHATTDRGGSYRLTDLPAGPCAIEIHISGQIPDVAPLELK